MKLNQSTIILVDCIVPCLLLVFMGIQWWTSRIVERIWDRSSDEAIPHWTRGRIGAYILLSIVSLLAFPLAAYSAWVAFFVPPWWIFLPCIALFLLDGLVGLVLAGGLIAGPERRTGVMIVTGILSVGLLIAALTRV